MRIFKARTYFLLLWLYVMISLLLPGCTSVQPQVVPETETSLQEQGRVLLKAIARKDFKLYVRCSGDVSGIDDEKGFLNSCSDMEKRLGSMDNWQFLTSLKTPGMVNLIYQVEFSRKQSRGGKLVHQQLMQLVFGKVDGSYRLLGMRIM